MTPSPKPPHLTPATLVGQRFAPNTFGDAKIALIGYCPPPAALELYQPIVTTEQYFIHVPPESVKRLSYNGMNFLSLVHVYGGPVSASTVEELAYYGFDYILAYGLAGGLGTKNLRMGDYYLVERAYADDGTTPHYTTDQIIASDETLKSQILVLWNENELGTLHGVQAFTGDAIYREDDAFLEAAIARDCDIVNLDSAHLFAVSRINSVHKHIKTIQCGVISDVVSDGDHGEWDSNLSVMLSAEQSDAPNPLTRTGSIVSFYIERLAPILLGS